MVRVNRYLMLREYLSSLPIARRLLAPRFAPGIRKLVRRVDRTVLRLYPAEVRLRHEFNLWAENGVGESMELDHLWVADKTLDRMALAPGQRILDLGC